MVFELLVVTNEVQPVVSPCYASTVFFIIIRRAPVLKFLYSSCCSFSDLC